MLEKHLNIFNDGGDITFANAITADKKTITATNGNIVYDAAGTNFELNSQDSVKAGKNVTVTAKTLKLTAHYRLEQMKGTLKSPMKCSLQIILL